MSSLIVFSGKAGTGKTTLAEIVAKEERLTYIDYDTINQPFLEGIEKKIGLFNLDRYSFYRYWRDETYKTLWDITIENLKLGNSVVLSAPLTQELQNKSYPTFIREKAGVSFNLLLCYMAPPYSLHKVMMEKRNSIRDEDFINSEERFSSLMGVEVPQWEEETLILSSGDIEKNKKIVLERIDFLRRNIWV